MDHSETAQSPSSLSRRPQWQALQRHAEQQRRHHLRELFAVEDMPASLLPHRSFEGNRPSNTLLAERLTPHTLGTLVTLYDHSVFVQGVIWDIDSFDQWGVELGKALATRTAAEIAGSSDPELRHDGSTNTLIRHYRRLRWPRA